MRGSPFQSFLPIRTCALTRRWTPMTPQIPIAVVLARFDDLLARGLRELIESDPSLAIVAAEVEHRRIPAVLRAHRPDVAILDVGALAKLGEVRELSRHYPATRLVLLAKDPSVEECAQLLAFGASACLGRDTQSRDVLNAIHLASRGLQVIPRAAADSGRGSTVAGQLRTGRGTLSWPHCGTLIWPHPVRRAADCSSFMRLERKAAERDGITRGAVRADKKGPRPGGPVDPGAGRASWCPSPCGQAGVGLAVAAGAQTA